MNRNGLKIAEVTFFLSILFLLTANMDVCLAETGIKPNVEPGKVYEKSDLDWLFPRTFWGRNVLIRLHTISPESEISLAALPEERVMVVWKGSVRQYVDGEFAKMSEKDCIYLEKGSLNSVMSDGNTSDILEIFWPVPLDVVQRAGETVSEEKPAVILSASEPSVPYGTVFSYHGLQFIKPENQVFARMIQGKWGQVCFLRMAPGAEFSFVQNPEEQFVIVVRGWMDITIDGTTIRMKENNVVYLSSGMSYSRTVGPEGCDVISVFSPAHPEYSKALKERQKKYHSIIPPDARPRLIIDGRFDEPFLGMVEGPSWLNGKLYFSNQGKALLAVNPDESVATVNDNIAPVGTTPLPNGNFAICDLGRKAIIEMTPEGKVVKTLADSCDGKAFIGNPNDIITDKKGGIYFTINKFPIEEGVNGVFYLSPGGKVTRIIERDKHQFPNGCVLSSDDSRFYLNDALSDTVWVYDVNDDGILSNKRPFAELILLDDVLGRMIISFSDGMTIDTSDNLYVAAGIGIQVFDKTGHFLGHINFPRMTSHCVFGGDDLSTLYVTCRRQVYAIKTKMKGFQYPIR